jgi:hypothetical protein
MYNGKTPNFAAIMSRILSEEKGKTYKAVTQ